MCGPAGNISQTIMKPRLSCFYFQCNGKSLESFQLALYAMTCTLKIIFQLQGVRKTVGEEGRDILGGYREDPRQRI